MQANQVVADREHRGVLGDLRDLRDLVRWQLAVDTAADGTTERTTWDVTVTAQMFMTSAVRQDNEPVPVHVLYPDHWHGTYDGARGQP